MAVKILQHPRTVSWSRNPMVFELEGENYFSSIGSDIIATLTFSAVLSSFEKIIISWETDSREYEVVPNPSIENPVKIRPATEGMSLEEWVAQVAEDLRGDQILYDKYIISSVGAIIKIQARQKNVDYNLTITSFNPSKLTVSIANTVFNNSKNPNYTMLIELMVSIDGIHYESFTKSIIEPEDNSRAKWDVQEYLSAYLHTKAMQAKELSTTNVEIDSSSRAYYYLRLAEMYGSPQEVFKARESERFVAIYGGVPNVKLLDYLLPDSFLEGSVLDWIGNGLQRKIYSNQLDYASILNFGLDKSDIAVKCRIYGCDESIRTITLGTKANWKQYEKLIVRIDSKALATHGIDEISSIEIWIEKSGNRISKSQYIRMERKYHPFGNVLLFKNSLGNFETVYTHGKKEYGYEIKKESEVFEPIIDPSVMDAARKDLDLEIHDEVRINSGYFSKSEIARFRDFFLSDQKYILQNQKWHPVLLDTSSVKEYEDGNFLHGITFTLKYANEQVLWV